MYLARVEAEDKFPWFNLEKRAIWKCGDRHNAFIKKIKGIGLDVDDSIQILKTWFENLFFLAIFKF